jgi:undecaprenyl-diphosphatase
MSPAMTYGQALLLGIIQGLTEFLPISSSGHLVLVQHLLGLREAELSFDVSVHLGTLAAVILFFRRDIYAIMGGLLRAVRAAASRRSVGDDADRPMVRLAGLIVLGSLPTAVVGLLLHQAAERLFASTLITGVMLLVTGALLFTTRPRPALASHPSRPLEGLTVKDALLIGLIQGLAVMPGISRSGSTIAVGILTGIRHESAARFSFLLSIPAVAGAALLVLKDAVSQGDLHLPVCLLGGATALIVGYAALALLVFLVEKGRLFLFAPYCWIIGGLAIALSLFA